MHGSNYGAELVKWNKKQCHSWEIVGYQKAQYILSAQRHMMQFLRSVVQTLLEEMQTPYDITIEDGFSSTGAGQTPSPRWDQLVQNDFFSFGTPSVQSSITFANQPFSAPPQFDPISTVELVESLYQQSVDEFDLAQTDPAYMQYLVSELAASAYFERMDEGSRLDFYVDEIPCNLYPRLIWWRQVARECKLMKTAYETHRTNPTIKNRVAYEQSILVLQDISIEHLTGQIQLLKYRFVILPRRDYSQSANHNQSADAARA